MPLAVPAILRVHNLSRHLVDDRTLQSMLISRQVAVLPHRPEDGEDGAKYRRLQVPADHSVTETLLQNLVEQVLGINTDSMVIFIEEEAEEGEEKAAGKQESVDNHDWQLTSCEHVRGSRQHATHTATRI